ncbi:hypothetical protein FA13DRAFT_194672 [Coprinellus micaceus]|uniref:Uncharacterized protein n=1 Tax=Coprinellus micaceus TaxID=71717 RepID=A0A4Y7TGB4_COPMI|nr:hypothetical protein FA13DRAFT_194672 [Coprinellus micaceus]
MTNCRRCAWRQCGLPLSTYLPFSRRCGMYGGPNKDRTQRHTSIAAFPDSLTSGRVLRPGGRMSSCILRRGYPAPAFASASYLLSFQPATAAGTTHTGKNLRLVNTHWTWFSPFFASRNPNKYLPPADSRVDTSQDSRAFVDFLAFQYLTIPARKNAFLDRLRGMGGCRQKAIAEALVFRVEQLARTAEGSALRANARSMQLLPQFIAAITTNLVVWKALRAVSYLKLSAAALASIAKAIQADAGTHDPELTVNFHKCFLGLARCATFGGPSLASAVLDILSADDHFFKLANMAVPNSPQNPPEYLFEAIGELLPYIYSSATFHAIILAGHALRFRDTTIKPYEDRVQTKGLPLDTQDTAIDFACFFSRPHEAYLYKPECHSLP